MIHAGKTFCFGLLACLALSSSVVGQDVVINEIMYDTALSGTETQEWVELHNTTGESIDISGWYVADNAGAVVAPAGTTLAPHGYVVLCEVSIPEIEGEVVCPESGWALSNSGEPLALYDASAALIDGSTSVAYPDDAPSNAGYSIEKIDETAPWTGDTAAWDPSMEEHPGNVEHIRHTAGYINSVAAAGTPTPTSTGPTATPTDTQPPSPTPTGPTPTPPPIDAIKINEIYINPPGTDVGCYVELFFPGGINLNGYSLVGVNGNGGADYNIIPLDGQVIPSDGFFVIAMDSSVANADLINALVDYQNGPDSIQLRSGATVVDAIGYGDFSGGEVFGGEGNAAPAYFTGTHSHSRIPDGNDTNDNSVDFVSGNLTAGLPNEPGAEATPTGVNPTFTPTPSGPTNTPTITPTAPPIYNLKINEVHVNADGVDVGSFVEIFNADSVEVPLLGYRLVGVNGFDGLDYNAIELTGSLPAGGYYVIAQDSSVPNADLIDENVDYQNGPDSIQLRASFIPVDAIGYGDFSGGETFGGEGTPVPYVNPTGNKSLSRIPDGTDTENNFADFVNGELTAGSQNVPAGSATSTPPPVTPTPTPPAATQTPTSPSNTPPPASPSPTPTESACTELGVKIYMPSNDFGPGDPCSCSITICNPTSNTYSDTPLFVILDVLGSYYFAPDFSAMDYYLIDVAPGVSTQPVLDEFPWPDGVGDFAGVNWYAGMTNVQMSNLLGSYDIFTFGWHD